MERGMESMSRGDHVAEPHGAPWQHRRDAMSRWETYPELGILRELGRVNPIADHLRKKPALATRNMQDARCNMQQNV